MEKGQCVLLIGCQIKIYIQWPLKEQERNIVNNSMPTNLITDEINLYLERIKKLTKGKNG